MNMTQRATWMVQGPPDMKGRVGTLNHKEFFNAVSVLHHSVWPGPKWGGVGGVVWTYRGGLGNSGVGK